MSSNSLAVDLFVESVMSALQQTQFDGVDIDWEFPVVNGAPNEPTKQTPQDASNYANLLVSLREGLDGLADQNKKLGIGLPEHYRITIAASATAYVVNAIQQADPFSWKIIAQVIDFVDIMTYDFHGPWDINQQPPYDVSDFIAPMETSPLDPFDQNAATSQLNIVDAVQLYLDAGFAPSQIIVGLPTYGYLEQVSELGVSYGLWQQITGIFPGQYGDGSGVYQYKCIRSGECHGFNKIPSDMMFIDPFNPLSYNNYSQEPYGYSVSTSSFVTFDDDISAIYKSCWVMQEQLAGTMIWELSGDYSPESEYSIIGAVYGAFNNLVSCQQNRK